MEVPQAVPLDRSIFDTNDLTISPLLGCISSSSTATSRLQTTLMPAVWSPLRNGWATFKMYKSHWLYITTGLVDKEMATRHIRGELHASYLCSSSNCIRITYLVFESPQINYQRMRCNASRICSCGLTPPCKLAQRVEKQPFSSRTNQLMSN